MAEVLLALSNGNDIATLSEDLHDELLGGVLWQTTDEHRLAPRRALSSGRRQKICQTWRRKVKKRDDYSVEGTVTVPNLLNSLCLRKH